MSPQVILQTMKWGLSFALVDHHDKRERDKMRLSPAKEEGGHVTSLSRAGLQSISAGEARPLAQVGGLLFSGCH